MGQAMQGIIFTELKRFVTVTCGEQAWIAVLAEARLTGSAFNESGTYSHFRAHEILGALSRLTGVRREKAYEAFGEFVTPTLFKQFESVLQRGVSANDFLIRFDKLLANTVWAGEPNPPSIRIESLRPGEFRMTHEAEQEMGDLFAGVLRAIGTQFGQQVLVSVQSPSELSVHLLSEASLQAH